MGVRGGTEILVGSRVPGCQGDNSGDKTISPEINCAFESLKGSER